MKINPEAQLAVKLYERKFQMRRAAGEQVHVITNTIAHDSGAVAFDAAKFKALARAIGRIDEAYCNRPLTNREVARNVKLNNAVRNLAESYGLKMTRNHDPRGFSVYLHFPDRSFNSWGGEETGWGI